MNKAIYITAFILFVVFAKVFHANSLAANQQSLLETNRKKIDSLDITIIKIIGQREKLVKEIGVYKAKNNIPPLQVSRFQEVLKNAIAAGIGQGLSEVFVTELMNAIHKESLRIENEIKSGSN